MVKIEKTKNVVKIKIDGSFRFENHNEFRNSYSEFLELKEDLSFVLDFARVNFIDSAALGMLLIFKEEVENSKKTPIKIVNSNQELMKIFEIANFGKLFEIV